MLKKIAPLLIVCAVIYLVIGLGSSIIQGASEEKTGNNTENSQESPVNANEDDLKPEIPAHDMGETFATDDLEITVKSVDWGYSVIDYVSSANADKGEINPKAGNQFIQITIDIKNTSDKSVRCDTGWFLEGVDGTPFNQYHYEAGNSCSLDSESSPRNNKQVSATYTIVFQLPENATEARLYYYGHPTPVRIVKGE